MVLEQDIRARLLTLNDLEEGQSYQETVNVAEELVKGFIGLTQDHALGHVDPVHAVKMGFKRCIVHGFLVSCGYSRMLGMFLPGSNTVIHRIQLDMLAPVFMDDVITYTVTVRRIIAAVKSVQLDLSAVNQDDKQVNKGTATCVFRI